MPDRAGLGVVPVLFFFFRPAAPPHSVLGHGLGNRTDKLRHGTAGFSCSFLFRLTDTLLRPEPGERLE